MRRAINPYNFVPFYSGEEGSVEPPSRKALEAYYPEPSALRSGWIDVKLTAKTALIAPDGSRYEKIPVAPAVAVTEPELSLHTLQILGEPRSSSFEFYLRKPDPEAIYWNYDFYGVRHTEKTKQGKTMKWTEYQDLPQATPGGRRFYWRSQPARDWDDELDKDKRKDMSASMEAAAGAEFTFRFTLTGLRKRNCKICYGLSPWAITARTARYSTN